MLPERSKSIAAFASSGLLAYEGINLTSSRQNLFMGTGKSTSGSVVAKHKTVPPRSTDSRACLKAGNAPAHTITKSASLPSLSWRTFAGISSRASMARSAPNSTAFFSRYLFISVTITLPAPLCRANNKCSRPEIPLPRMRTAWPAFRFAARWPRITQARGSIKVASSSDISEGSGKTPLFKLISGTRMYSAKPPGK